MEIFVKIIVGKQIKQYLENSFQSNVICPTKDSTLIGIIKQHLILSSDDDDFYPEDETVLVKLPLQNAKVYRQADSNVYVCNTLFRHSLSEEGQKKVKKFFLNNFRCSFHTFMDGFVEGQYETKDDDTRIKIKQGVVAYLNQYHIDFNEKLVASLTRDWWRHNNRIEGNRISPMIY